MARLYTFTGKEIHLEAAKLFDNDKLFYPMACNVDTLGGVHGLNTRRGMHTNTLLKYLEP